jgi:23S rRNA (uracil1939-C5)-methyltransferase
MTALCRHFESCGGCLHQDFPDEAYRALKRSAVETALQKAGVEAAIGDLVEVPPGTRRRASLKCKVKGNDVSLGFHAARSHDIVDMHECRVLTPKLVAVLPGLRAMFAEVLAPHGDADLRLTQTDTGIELALRWQKKTDTATLTSLARWADKLGLIRIAARGETVVSLGEPKVKLGKAMVPLPPETFLQPTKEGEAVLQSFAVKALAGCKSVADLFAGCGTLTFPLAEKAKVHAVELEAPMLEALRAGAKSTPGLKPITTDKRNIFKRPLTNFELNNYDGVCLDPPRAGALEQATMLAKSKVAHIAYISCDAESFARDAKVLIEGGYRLGEIVPVDQFLWSSHIELAAAFTR